MHSNFSNKRQKTPRKLAGVLAFPQKTHQNIFGTSKNFGREGGALKLILEFCIICPFLNYVLLSKTFCLNLVL